MGHAIDAHGLHRRIAQEDFLRIDGGGIALIGRLDILGQHAPDLPQALHKLHSHGVRPLGALRAMAASLFLQLALVHENVLDDPIEQAGRRVQPIQHLRAEVIRIFHLALIEAGKQRRFQLPQQLHHPALHAKAADVFPEKLPGVDLHQFVRYTLGFKAHPITDIAHKISVSFRFFIFRPIHLF